MYDILNKRNDSSANEGADDGRRNMYLDLAAGGVNIVDIRVVHLIGSLRLLAAWYLQIWSYCTDVLLQLVLLKS